MRALVLIFYPTLSPIKCFLSGVSLAHTSDAITCDDEFDDEFEMQGRIQTFFKRRFICIKVWQFALPIYYFLKYPMKIN